MSKIQAIFFDIDGTLIDTTEFILQAFEHTIKTHQLPYRSRQEITQHIGPPLVEMYQLLAPTVDQTALFNTHVQFQEEHTHLVQIFSSTKDVLQTLRTKNILVAAVTNRSVRSLTKSLAFVGLDHSFDYIVAFEDVSEGKPSPEGIKKALSFFHLKPDQAVMVGDTNVDIVAGKAAGVTTVGITTGFFDKKRLEKESPDFIIDNLSELTDLVL